MKFKCRAYGLRKVNLDPVSDLKSMLAALFGVFFARIYSQRFKFAKEVLAEFRAENACEKTAAEPSKATIEPSTKLLFNNAGLDETASYVELNSTLYKTIFRSGLATHLSQDSAQMNRFLNGLVNFYNAEFCVGDAERSFMSKFLAFYEAQHQKLTKKAKIMNSDRINGAVVAIFASLLWHCPCVKYENLCETKLELFANEDPADDAETELKLNEHILQAYKAAESTRMLVIEQQQLSKMSSLQNADTDTTSTNTDASSSDFIERIMQKASFALTLERMTRVATKFELDDDYDYESNCRSAHGTSAATAGSKTLFSKSHFVCR